MFLRPKTKTSICTIHSILCSTVCIIILYYYHAVLTFQKFNTINCELRVSWWPKSFKPIRRKLNPIRTRRTTVITHTIYVPDATPCLYLSIFSIYLFNFFFFNLILLNYYKTLLKEHTFIFDDLKHFFYFKSIENFKKPSTLIGLIRLKYLCI